MKKIIYILIIVGLTSCKLFSQPPDTLTYYTKSWGDSMKVVNQNLQDSIAMRDSSFNAMMEDILDMKLNNDTAYWENTFADFTFKAMSENGMAEAEIILTDSTFMRLLYVGNSMNCMVKNKNGWIKGQLNFNFDK